MTRSDRRLRGVRLLLLGLLAPFALSAAMPAVAADVAVRPADGTFLLDGRGFGHGRGMSQYGAYGAALRGLSYAQILAFYYNGADLGTAPGALRRVLLTGEDADLTVTNSRGLVLRNDASGATLDTGARADWSRIRVRSEGSVLSVEALQGGAWTSIWPPVSGPVRLFGLPVLELHHPAGVRRYRGELVAALSGQSAKPLYVVNSVGIDDYVRGVVAAEMPAGWHREALRAQAVAARSYGLRPCPQPTTYPATGLYDVIDTIFCQAYGGVNAEATSTNAAVADTSTQVLRYGGTVLRTEFSASNGGWTVAAGGPYVAKEDPYNVIGAEAASRTEVHRWTGARVPAATLEAKFGTGTLREIRVLERDGRGEWGGRVLRVRLVGDSSTVEISGDQLRFAVGLRSNWFDLVVSNPIDAKYASLGGSSGFLGAPVAAEAEALGGRFRRYATGSIYWSSSTGAREVHGGILGRWAGVCGERGPMGEPGTDELGTPDGRGRYNHFQFGGSIYWSAATGSWALQGAIRQKWADLGWERGALGYPTTNESSTPDGVGRYNHFQSGSVYWSPATGAREVRGAILGAWGQTGWERGRLGYPTSDEYDVSGGRAGNFQGGRITWNRATGATTVAFR